MVKYIDMPLQHADDAMLRAMKRERSAPTLCASCSSGSARAVPGVVLRTSFIVGFPGETDAAFATLVDFVREQQFDRVGVFTYSREENTAAFDLPGQVPSASSGAAGRIDGGAAEISLKRIVTWSAAN